MVSGKVFIGDSRDLSELEDNSIDLIVTSPPYWHIKDYGYKEQIGHGQDLHGYLKDLFLVWKECTRVIRPGRRICINIGDQFARSSVYGRYKVIPLHAEIISQLEMLSMDYMGSIIWQKKTTMNTSGGAVVMGSYPYPPNGIVEIDYEHILIFKKPGSSRKVDRDIKDSSKLTKEEWKEYHNGHWNFGGVRQVSHEAMFPDELPTRLIKMFTFKGEKVLDPFLGSGTTIKASMENGRDGIGFELNHEFLPIIKKKFGKKNSVEVISLGSQDIPLYSKEYIPRIQNADPPSVDEEKIVLERVKDIGSDLSLIFEDGKRVKIAGIDIIEKRTVEEYLLKNVKGKDVSLKDPESVDGSLIFLKNKIYINGEILKKGWAKVVDDDFEGKKRLVKILKRS